MNGPDYVALEGKICVVTLQQNGGTNYDWCLTKLPSELSLWTVDSAPVPGFPPYGGPVERKFYFLVTGSEHINVELGFALTCVSDPSDAIDTCTVSVRVIPKNHEEFASLNAGVAVDTLDGGMVVKYGYPCGAADSQSVLKYGYPCGMADGQVLKYGYPCGAADGQIVKYGYPCGVADSQAAAPRAGENRFLPVKYGYPCAAGGGPAIVDYGYPCGAADPRLGVMYSYPGMLYGYPCGVSKGLPMVAYGYPCGYRDGQAK